MKNVSKTTNLAVKLSLLSAIAVIFMYFEFPVLPAYSWLKIDISDVPALIGAFAFGPLAGIAVEAFKNILIILIKGSSTGFVGEFANFLIGASFVVPAGIIYSKKRSKTGAAIALITSTIIMSLIGILANYYILMPLFGMKLSTSNLIRYIVYGIIPFNMIKGILISVITLLIYKRVSILIRAENYQNEMKKL